MDIFLSTNFWLITLAAGTGVLVFVARNPGMKGLLQNTYFAVTVSLVIALSYFVIVDHYLMDIQGLDYWYLFRK